MKFKIKWWEYQFYWKRYRVRVVVGTFVKSNGSHGKQHILFLQIIFYDSPAILIIKFNMLLSCRSSLCCIKYWESLTDKLNISDKSILESPSVMFGSPSCSFTSISFLFILSAHIGRHLKKTNIWFVDLLLIVNLNLTI
jgi:hypothetical protein